MNDYQRNHLSAKKDKTLRVAVLGTESVGKSSLVSRFVMNRKIEQHEPTIEDTKKTTVKIDNVPYNVEILDTAGRKDYQGSLEDWVQQSDGFILVFSITDKESFFGLQKCYDAICNNAEEKPIILVGNKKDLASERVVIMEDALNIAEEFGAAYYETSALTDEEGVCRGPFTECVRKIVKEEKSIPRKTKKKGTCTTCSAF